MTLLCIAGSALIFTALFVGYNAITRARFFRLEHIEISETGKVSRQAILEATGITPGDDLLRMDIRQIGEQLLRNPWVETVRINRYFPDSLSIAVTERKPLALVNMSVVYYMDSKGIIFKSLDSGDNLDYPVLTGFTEEWITTDPEGSREALLQACALLGALREKGSMILADLSEINYEKDSGFTIFSTSGALQIRIGSDDFAPRIERFARIYSDIMSQKKNLKSIDLDYDDKIVIKKKSDIISEAGRGIHVSNKKG